MPGAKTTHDFLDGFTALQSHVNETAKDKGWWENARSDGECIALMHSELSEALEYLRAPADERYTEKPLYDSQGVRLKGVEEELADVVIRVMDFAEHRGLDIAGAIIAKAHYNESRPYKHGGKAF